MRVSLRVAAAAVLILGLGCASAKEEPATQRSAPVDALALFASILGDWRGSLVYIDYQSQQRFGIPLELSVSVTPDGATVKRDYVYTDPNNLVYAQSLLTAEQITESVVRDNPQQLHKSQRLTEAYFRDRGAEFFNYNIQSAKVTSPQDWTLVYTREGMDDDRSATIRQTLRRKGDVLTDSKEVRFHNQSDDLYILRNVVELERVASEN